ncbi:hypothetical protein HYW55_03255 [Candidatus Gottesmanbacteria bacterium]|nr:hypothetical protein [Candidatus Gottesmanbacteria bacterium]
MYFAIRADASTRIGLGHVSRQSDIANDLRDKGIRTIFFTRSPLHVLPFIQKRSHAEIVVLPKDKNGSLNILKRYLSEKKPKGIMIDLLREDKDSDYTSLYREQKITIFSTTDDPNPRDVDCDVQFCCNPHQSKRLYPKSSVFPKRYFGLRYFIINETFLTFRFFARSYQNKISNILVLFGGVNSIPAISIVLEAISLVTFHPTTTIIISPVEKGYSSLEKLAHRLGLTVHFLTSLSSQNIAASMKESDVLIGSAGNGAYEASVIGTPFLAMNQVPRQNENAAFLEERKACINFGLYKQVKPSTLGMALERLFQEKLKRESMGKLAMKLVDGRGKERVVEIIRSYIS